MSRVKLTANNHCHKPVKGGAPVEALIDAAADNRLTEYLAQGNSLNVTSKNGISALHALARNKSGTKRDQIALQALLGAGINVDLVNHRNETALFRALITKSDWMIGSLLEYGASVDLINNKGETMEDVAGSNLPLLAVIRARRLDQNTPSVAYTRPRRSI